MSDWIVNSAFDIGIDNVQVDILNKEIFANSTIMRFAKVINIDYLVGIKA